MIPIPIPDAIGIAESAVGVLGEIVSLGKAVYDHAQLVKANQEQCKRLAGRIQIVVKSVQDLDMVADARNFRTALKKMRTTLMACLDFVDQFRDKNWFKKVLRAGAYKDRFEELTSDVQEASRDLNLGLTAQQIVNRDQDREDQRIDLDTLKANQGQILALAEVNIKEQRVGHQYLQSMRQEGSQQQEVLLQQLASVKERLEQLGQLGQSPSGPRLFLDQKFEVSFFDLGFESLLRKERFGTTYLGRWQGTTVEIKSLDRELSDTDYAQFVREAQVMSRIHHPHIISFLGACLEQKRACLVMERMEQGSLADMILARKKWSEDEKRQIILDVACGLLYLHNNKIFHRDLTKASVLLGLNGRAKLANLGLAKLQTQSLATVQVGVASEAYLAPELFRYKEKYTAACDVYSFGYLIWELFTGKEAFGDFKGDLISHIRGGGHEVIPSDIPVVYADLMRSCWDQDPKKRPQLTELIAQLEQYTPRPVSPSPEALYEEGLGCESRKDQKGAFEAYRRASDKGFFKAHTNLSSFFLQGLGGARKDPQEAHRLLNLGAKAGHVRAQHNLASLYVNGVGTSKDVNQAIFWYQKAAAQGDARAQEKADMLTQTFSMQGNLNTRK